MKKLLFMIVTFLFAINIALAADLSDYPSFFIEGTELKVDIIVGDRARAEDMAGAKDIGVSLQAFTGAEISGETDSEVTISSGSTHTITTRGVDYSTKASDIDDIKKINAIVIGNPDKNPLIEELYPEFSDEVKDGEAVIKVFENNNKIQIIVAGPDVDDTRKAARILSRWKENDLKGSTHRIGEGGTITQQVDLEEGKELVIETVIESDDATKTEEIQKTDNSVSKSSDDYEDQKQEKKGFFSGILNWLKNLF
ncbi:hypothetical protein ACFL0W_03105 [Nanoarchaeota archaeon]